MTQDKKEKILSLISKLKSLATNNPDQEEAALAGARMQELIDRYKIAQAELLLGPNNDGPETDCFSYYSEEGKRFARWRLNLAYSVADANNCEAVRSHGYHTWDDTTGTKVLHPAKMLIVGTEESVLACRYVFAYLCREVDRLAVDALRKFNLRTGYKGGKAYSNAFRAGAVDAIRKRLKEQKGRIREEVGSALVLFDRETKAAQDWVNANLNTQRARCPMTATDAVGYSAGRRAGKGIRLGDAVGKSLSQPRKELR